MVDGRTLTVVEVAMEPVEVLGLTEVLTPEVEGGVREIFGLPQETQFLVRPVKRGFEPPMIFLTVPGVGLVSREQRHRVQVVFGAITIRTVIVQGNNTTGRPSATASFEDGLRA